MSYTLGMWSGSIHTVPSSKYNTLFGADVSRFPPQLMTKEGTQQQNQLCTVQFVPFATNMIWASIFIVQWDNDYGGTAIYEAKEQTIKQSLTSISCEVTLTTQRYHLAAGWVFMHPLKSYQFLF